MIPLIFFIVLGFLAYLLALVWTTSRPWIRVMAYLPPIVVILVAPPYSRVGPIVSWIAAVVLNEWLHRRVLDSTRSGAGPWGKLTARRTLLLLFAPILWWLSTSLLDIALRPRAHPPDPDRFSGVVRRPDADVALALSGGGLRAALFHAGVMAELEEHDLAPRLLSTVSGGSIIGAFYAAGGTPTEFRDRLIDGQLGLRGYGSQIAPFVRFLFDRCSRTGLQADLLDRALLGGITLGSLADHPGAPTLLLCTTDLASGLRVGWTPTGYVMDGLPSWDETSAESMSATSERRFNCFTAKGVHCKDQLRPYRLSRLVAASGAFPGAFDAQAIPRYDWKDPPDQVRGPSDSFFLADGGVLDNSGISLLLAALYCDRTEPGDVISSWFGKPVFSLPITKTPKVIIESDASGIFEHVDDISSIASITRWADVMYGATQSLLRAVNKDFIFGGSPLRTVRISPQQFHMPRPLATFDELASAYVFIFDQVNEHASGLRQRISRRFPDHAVRASNKEYGFLIDVFQEKLEEFALRRALLEAATSTLQELCTVAPFETTPIDGDDLIQSRRNFERDTQRGNTQFIQSARFIALNDDAARLAIAARDRQFAERNLELLCGDIMESLRTYSTIGTLDDHLTADDANAIFRLGRYLTCLRLPAIEKALTQGP